MYHHFTASPTTSIPTRLAANPLSHRQSMFSTQPLQPSTRQVIHQKFEVYAVSVSKVLLRGVDTVLVKIVCLWSKTRTNREC